MKVVLELQDQPSNVRKVTVRHDIVIGRGADCNLRLSAPQISRRHCFLRVGRDGVSVTDLDSSNGTYVDGKRIKGGKRAELTNGSLLAIGPIRFLIHVRDESVVDQVLKPGAERTVAKSGVAGRPADSSTVVGNASAIISGEHAGIGQVLKLSLEQAGSAAGSSEVTAEVRKEADASSEFTVRKHSQLPEGLDSIAEIVDPGRRIAGMDAEEFVGRQAEIDPEPPTFAGDSLSGGEVADQQDHDQIAINGEVSPDNLSFFDDCADLSRISERTGNSPRDFSDVVAYDPEIIETEEICEDVEVVEDEIEEVVEADEQSDWARRTISSSTDEIIDVVEEVWDDSEVLEIASPVEVSVVESEATFEQDADVSIVEVLIIEEIFVDSTSSGEKVADAQDAEFFDDLEVLDDEEVAAEEMVEIVEEDIEILDDVEEFIEVAEVNQPAAGAMEPEIAESEAELVEEDEEGEEQDWFAGRSDADADEDIDPELRKFLKGF